MLEREFKYYREHLPELVSKYLNKFIVIKDENVVGVYDTEKDAYGESVKKFELGTFLIQFCSKDQDTYTQTFHSRVIFA